MYVVCHATNFEGRHFVLPRDTAQERPKPCAERRRDQRAAFFGAKNTMKIGADV